MGRWQPYLYDAPHREPDFNPKAVTIASRLPPASPTKKTDGPLVNFNKHPDSYLILPYGKKNVKPMTPKTKTIVKWVRWVQLFFRLCTLLGAIGVLLCAIFVKGAQDTEGYIMRIPPGVDIVICLYAIYHLLRNAKSRPAGSSASYHFFALVTDAGLIPFYVFTSLLSKRNLNMEAGTSGRWRTFFPTDEETEKVLLTLWLTVTTVGGLHIASLFIDLYLLVIFRMISKLPPDMNPLEENLTSRRKTKHKHKNSSISAMAPLTGDDKRFSAQSSNTAVTRNRASQADSYMSEKDIPTPDKSQMAFMHTRNNSEMTYSPHTPNSARHSKERFSMYAQSPSARQSRGDLNRRDDLYRKEIDDDEETLAQRKSYLAQQAIKRHSKNNSFATSSSKQDFYTPPGTSRAERQEETGDIALQNSRETLQSDNWFVHPEPVDSTEHEDPIVAATRSMFNVKPIANGYSSIAPTDDAQDEPLAAPKRSMFPSKAQANGYSSLAVTEDAPDQAVSPVSSMFQSKTQANGYTSVSAMDDVSDEEYEPPMVPQPLRMNPPTPPPSKFLNEVKSTPPPSSLKKTQTAASISTDPSVTRSPTRTSTPKSRYYGDLQSATLGIRSGLSPANSPQTSPTKSTYRNAPNDLPSSTKQYTTNSPSSAKKDYVKNSPFTLDKKSFASVRRTGETSHTPVKNQSPRVVSRSGVDYEGLYDWEDSPNSGTPGRRREVSGKIAEEGRGGITGGNWGGMKAHVLTYRKVSGVA